MSDNIQIDDSRKRFLIISGDSAYGLGVGKEGFLISLHWGGALHRIDELPEPEELQSHRHCPPQRNSLFRQEYPGWGGEFYSEPALKAEFPGGVRNCVLKYLRHQLADDRSQLTVILGDPDYPLEAALVYKPVGDGIIERHAIISNLGGQPVILNSVMSAVFHPPYNDHAPKRLSHISGRWGKEYMIERQEINQDKITLESRTGLSGPFAQPFFALDEGYATEESGRVWFGALHWSGNWKITVERNGYGHIGISGGINDFDFSWLLQPGESFNAPVFAAGVSDHGFGEMSRMLHRYQTRQLLPTQNVRKPMPVIFNSWAGLGVNVNEDNILNLAEKAARIGAELFVIDDGWQRALGDWTPDPVKFPNGLKPVVDKVRQLGMDFGLWVEIESFEINSELHARHPEWAMQYPQREIHRHHREDVKRSSALLNFAREDVAEFMYDSLRALFRSTGIRYLKLDMNYNFTTPGWDNAPAGRQRELWVRYVHNLHKLFGRLREEFPDMLFENCAAGSSRADLGMARMFSRINRSDNQDTLDILRLHEGFTWLHPSRLAGGACHISDAVYGINLRHIPMKFQAYTGMMGSLAVGKNLNRCTEQELDEITSYVSMHKELRHIPQFGQLYRLASHREHPYAAFLFVSLDRSEAMLFALGHSIQFGDRVPAFVLKGLEPETLYTINCFGNNPQGGHSASIHSYPDMSGRALMECGVRVELLGDYDARILRLRKSAVQSA